MGMRSAFRDEENIHLYDEEFYNFCKSIINIGEDISKFEGGKNWVAEAIVEWYDKNRDKKTKKLPEFTFEIFHDWKIQGYWYSLFCQVIDAMGKFLRQVDDNEGSAEFEYEEGQPFRFELDYEKKKVSVNYVPPTWEHMEMKENFKKPLKVSKEILERLEKLEVEDRI